MRLHLYQTILVGATLALALMACEPTVADQPKLGTYGEVVPVHQGFFRGYGYRVDSVCWFSHAADMGLERRDIIVTVDNQFFENIEAYRYALRQTGTIARIGIINCRNGELIYRKCRLNHTPHYGEQPPMGYGAIN